MFLPTVAVDCDGLARFKDLSMILARTFARLDTDSVVKKLSRVTLTSWKTFRLVTVADGAGVVRLSGIQTVARLKLIRSTF